MGLYINLGNEGFASAKRSNYVDKSSTIGFMNSVLETEHRYVCVTRARRFGKSMMAKMLCAYYDKSCDSRPLFEDLQIAHHLDFGKHLNKYPVIYLDMTGLLDWVLPTSYCYRIGMWSIPPFFWNWSMIIRQIRLFPKFMKNGMQDFCVIMLARLCWSVLIMTRKLNVILVRSKEWVNK